VARRAIDFTAGPVDRQKPHEDFKLQRQSTLSGWQMIFVSGALSLACHLLLWSDIVRPGDRRTRDDWLALEGVAENDQLVFVDHTRIGFWLRAAVGILHLDPPGPGWAMGRD
jgi:hypothetical protein